MKIEKILNVPTGKIVIAKCEQGRKLEFLSIGDYGKAQNVKASFLGLDKNIEGVPNGKIMPLEEKWVVTVSTQYGCSMGCVFCDVPKVGPGINIPLINLSNQIREAIKLHPDIKETKRLNVHYARMGEPTFNKDVIKSAMHIKNIAEQESLKALIHPVISTMMPKNNKKLKSFLHDWCDLKNNFYAGDAGLQFSINSTSDKQRNDMFSGNSLFLNDISSIVKGLPTPKGRKYALNFALADGYEVDAGYLCYLFDPAKCMVKITPLHKTKSCVENNISTSGGYEEFTPYKDVEEDLKHNGFDVLIFVPSYEEDLGRITCGNAILSGTKPEVEYTEENS